MCDGRVDHADEGEVVDVSDAVVYPDAVMVKFMNAPSYFEAYRSHCLQCLEVAST